LNPARAKPWTSLHGLGREDVAGHLTGDSLKRRRAVLTSISNRLYSKNAVTFYKTASGRSPVLDYIRDLAKPERARLLEALDQIERHGFDAVRVQFRQIEGKLWEIRISAHRVFYVLIDREEMVLLHAYKKQGQKLPPKGA
jgi:phage-related protein